ncbi:MAG: Na+/H+ antiporter NhaC family protein [Sandaracinaceae bacterium]
MRPKRILAVLGSVVLVGATSIALAQTDAGATEAPTALSLLPALLAIVLAIWLREVIVALVSGVWLGATFLHGNNPFTGLLRAADTYAVGALADADHASIAIFSLLLGGMIGVLAKSGGALGLAQIVTGFAKDRRSGALATWLMGLAIFFDDYSNSLLVGATMRPITDKLRISREKLSFLVDATSAPVSSFAIVSSWVGVEVGYIADQYAAAGIEGDPYLVFLETIPYRFYPLLMLFFGLLLILMKRDFGPMYAAEHRAVTTGQVSREGADLSADFESAELQPVEGVTPRWYNAVIPIVVVVVTAISGMAVTGHDALLEARTEAQAAVDAARVALDAATPEGIEAAGDALTDAERALSLLDVNARNVFGKANSLRALLWAALLGGVVAIFLAVVQRILTVRQAMEAWASGVRSIVLAVMILVLAWSLGDVCQELHTAQYVIGAIGGWLPPSLLPAMVFVIAAAVSFATGTSWGTMGILFPLVIPLAHQLSPEGGVIVLGSVASILSGSVWGDHCSPISDTTVMSSMASSCDHVDHVRTQLPYALAVGAVSLIATQIAVLDIPGAQYLALVVCGGILFAVVRYAGKRVPDDAQVDATPGPSGATRRRAEARDEGE